MRRAWLLAAVLAGCGDKAVEVSLQVPSAQVSALYDTSCVTAVEIYVDGGNYPTDEDDYLRDCVDVTTPGATFQAVKDRIHNKFDTKIPASGMSGIELFAYNGACTAAREEDYDLIFYASAPYLGDDSMTLQITPNVSCTPKQYTMRPIDLLAYVKTASCATSAWTTGKIALSTLSPLPFTDSTFWWGGQAAGTVGANGTVQVTGLADNIGPKSCLATGLYTDDWYEVTCLSPPDQRVCATGGEIEAPMIDIATGYQSQDMTKINRFGGMVVGAVVGPGPLSGATVTIDDADADKGEVVYFDAPATDGAPMTPHAGNSTGTSGLFGIYTMSVLHVTITWQGKTLKRTLAGNDEDLSAVFVKMM